MTLNRNLTDFHTEMEQVRRPQQPRAGDRAQPGQVLLARGFSYADAHRARLGVNYKQIPVDSPHVPSTATARTARCDGSTSPTPSTPPTPTGVRTDPSQTDQAGLWASDGDMVRSVYTPRSADDDFVQARTQVREVLDEDARERLVSNIAGHLADGVADEVLARAGELEERSTRSSAIASSKPSVPASRPKPQGGPRQESPRRRAGACRLQACVAGQLSCSSNSSSS